MLKRIGAIIVSFLALVIGFLYVAGKGWLGAEVGAGVPMSTERSAAMREERSTAQRDAAREVRSVHAKEVLFGDFHVHTSFSMDAFMTGMPLTGGSGSHTVSDACDFARYCSSLDFWSVNDHAESSTPRRWRETIEAIRQCNAIGASEGAEPETDLISYLGWEWSHMGTTAENHYGHRNVVLRDLAEDEIPSRPIASDSPADYLAVPSTFMLGMMVGISRDPEYLRFANYQQETGSVERCPDDTPVRDLPDDCREYAATPGELLRKLDDWGFPSLAIPHGTTWGMYTPQGSSFAKQLTAADHDPKRQRLVEVYSGHGNTEQYRSWKEVAIDANGTRHCPEPRDDFLPGCWQAGEIIRKRCRAAGESEAECESRAVSARQHYVDAPAGMGHLSVPGVIASEWLDAGQCRDLSLIHI